jgi:glycerophosphoryl diester phosphodiesterase
LDIIAHRGASAYLPEHSLPAKALAYGMGADYLEQDIVASRDGELLVLHDLYLDHVSDVAARFPDRARPDGHFYCIDFDLDEIRRLRFIERRDPKTGNQRYAQRFPREAGGYRVVTLGEEIGFVQALNRATGREVGIYPEIKAPAWHRENGIELGDRLLTVLEAYGYLTKNSKIYVQCFDFIELKRIKDRVGTALPLIQLIGSRYFTDGEAARPGLRHIARFAAGIGPSLALIYGGPQDDGTPKLSQLVEESHDTGLVVHPYTFRADDLPPGIDSFETLLEIFIGRLKVDGLFTDFPDRVSASLSKRNQNQSRPQ